MRRFRFRRDEKANVGWSANLHFPVLSAPPFQQIFATLRGLETRFHALSFYGATAITAFGWAVCDLLGWRAAPWLPLWFSGAILIYNLDRLRPDPADAINTPKRAAASNRLRGASAASASVATAVLVAIPIFARDWLTLALVIGGGLMSVNYSIPLLGFRFKDVPLLKTFFAPAIVLAAIIGLPILHGCGFAADALFIATMLCTFGLLLFNMILCDLRDVLGDQRESVISLPVFLGEKRTRDLLATLLVAIESLALAAFTLAPPPHRLAWAIICAGVPSFLGWLLFATRAIQSERFYEWTLEGVLFLPAAACAAAKALSFFATAAR